jgi:hypothetical protein
MYMRNRLQPALVHHGRQLCQDTHRRQHETHTRQGTRNRRHASVSVSAHLVCDSQFTTRRLTPAQRQREGGGRGEHLLVAPWSWTTGPRSTWTPSSQTPSTETREDGRGEGAAWRRSARSRPRGIWRMRDHGQTSHGACAARRYKGSATCRAKLDVLRQGPCKPVPVGRGTWPHKSCLCPLAADGSWPHPPLSLPFAALILPVTVLTLDVS